MKRKIFVSIVGLILCIALKGNGQSTSSNSPAQNHRYEILSAEYDFVDLQAGAKRVKAIFKFDSQTGQCRVLVMGADSKTNSLVSSWMPISN
jgi:hypothetical protein